MQIRFVIKLRLGKTIAGGNKDSNVRGVSVTFCDLQKQVSLVKTCLNTISIPLYVLIDKKTDVFEKQQNHSQKKHKSLQLLKDCTVSQTYFWNFSKHFIAVFLQNTHKMLLLSKCMKHRIERFFDQICCKQCNLKVQLFWPH